MLHLRHILLFTQKEIIAEWRNKYALGGIVLYVVTTVFVIYTALSQAGELSALRPQLWNILFWITILFTAVNAIAKSFFQESKGRFLYYYTLTSSLTVLFAKMLYNLLLMLLLTGLCLGTYTLMLEYPAQQQLPFLAAVFLGGTSLAFLFSMISAIASKAGNNSTLIAILGFPVILPLFVILIKLSGIGFTDMEASDTILRQVGMLAGLNVVVIALSFILFPYLWRD